MLSIATDGLYRDCCNRQAPRPIGGGEGPCPEPPDVIIFTPIQDAMELQPEICDTDEFATAPDILEIVGPDIEESKVESDELMPEIISTDDGEDCC